MKAMILAAGRGERMRPLTDRLPKPLLEVLEKPLIVWHLENLARAGFKEIVINHAYLGKQIEDAVGNGARWGLSITYSAEVNALETAGGIANALALLGDGPFLVVNADIFTDMDFGHLKDVSLKDRKAHLVMVDNPEHHLEGDFFYSNGELSSNQGLKLTFSGIGVYEPALFDGILPGHAARLAPILTKAILNGWVSAEKYSGVWSDIGTPERLKLINEELKEKHVESKRI